MATALPTKLKLEVATPLGLKLSVECDSVEARSVDGYFDVLPGHLPMLATLRGGLLKYTEGTHTKVVAVGEGFVEAEPNCVRILADAFATAAEVNAAAVEKERAEVNEKMKAFPDHTSSAAFHELQKRADWLEAQLDCQRTGT